MRCDPDATIDARRVFGQLRLFHRLDWPWRTRFGREHPPSVSRLLDQSTSGKSTPTAILVVVLIAVAKVLAHAPGCACIAASNRCSMVSPPLLHSKTAKWAGTAIRRGAPSIEI